jgi:hypothetical protein
MNTENIEFHIKAFLKKRSESVTIQLLIPENYKLDDKICLDSNSEDLASFAFCAYLDSNLIRLDELFTKWKILEKGTADFKGKLRENWLLEENENKRRNVSNDTLSAISELLVADYFENNCSRVIDLAAWGNKEADVVLENEIKKEFVEAKFFPYSPELYRQGIEAGKNCNGVSSGFISKPNTTLNYFYYRIAEASIQLTKIREDKSIFIVFDQTASKGRKCFENGYINHDRWYKGQNGDHLGILENKKEYVLSKSPKQWLDSITHLYIGSRENFHLINVKRLI